MSRRRRTCPDLITIRTSLLSASARFCFVNTLGRSFGWIAVRRFRFLMSGSKVMPVLTASSVSALMANMTSRFESSSAFARMSYFLTA